MNEPTTMSDWSKNEQEFADVIINIIESSYRKHEQDCQEGKESKRVQLEKIHFRIADLKAFPHVMQGIKPYQKPESTIPEMLGLLSRRGEIVKCQR